jgi:glycine cleavage system H protein
VNPKSLKYHREHDWARIEGDTAVFGLTHYAQETLGDIVFIELPEVGADVLAATPYAEVESVKAVSDVYAPLSGSVEEGWLIKVRLTDPSEADDLLTADEYNEFLAAEE